MNSVVHVVLSGGVGSRLWPLSRKSRPKQYLPIFEGETLFQKTISRNKPFTDKVLIVGNKENYELSQRDLQDAGISDYDELVEACPRNTAAAIAFAALHCPADAVLFVTPSDHLIESGQAYSSAVIRAIQLAKEGFIVTFGLKPERPETGYGYIEAEGEEVKAFHEKPAVETANFFFRQGNFLWNSGMFCFQAGLYLEELRKYSPEVFDQAFAAYQMKSGQFLPEKESRLIPSISVDYAIMEKSQKIKVVPSSFGWSDMGSFESIYDYLKSQGHQMDAAGNMAIGSAAYIEFTGLSNTILVFTQDAVLALKKANSQAVKEVFARLEQERPELVE